jgi:hypothetical protein
MNCGTSNNGYQSNPYTRQDYRNGRHQDNPYGGNSYGSVNYRGDGEVEVRADSVIIRRNGTEQVFPTRIDPKSTHTTTTTRTTYSSNTRKNSSAAKAIIVVFLLIFIFALCTIIGITVFFNDLGDGLEGLVGGERIDSEIISAANQTVSHHRIEEVDIENLGDHVLGNPNLYDNGEYLVCVLESEEYIDDGDGGYLYTVKTYLGINHNAFEDMTINSTEYYFNFRNGDESDVDMDMDVMSGYGYNDRLERIYLGTDYSIDRQKTLVGDGINFEVYEVYTSYDEYHYYIFGDPLTSTEDYIYIYINSEEPIDCSEIIVGVKNEIITS